MKRPDPHHEDYLQLQRYKDELMNVPENLTYDEIHEALLDRIPCLQRHDATHRTFEESGVNNLLDQLNALLFEQACGLLLVGDDNGS